MIDVHSLSLALSPPPACPHACLLVYCQAITYAIALEFWGQNKVHQHVGFEPSGRNFNELCLDEKRRPHNPMINSGAIMAVSLCFPSLPLADVRACTSCEAHASPLVGQDSHQTTTTTALRQDCRLLVASRWRHADRLRQLDVSLGSRHSRPQLLPGLHDGLSRHASSASIVIHLTNPCAPPRMRHTPFPKEPTCSKRSSCTLCCARSRSLPRKWPSSLQRLLPEVREYPRRPIWADSRSLTHSRDGDAAAAGTNPITEDRIFSNNTVRNCLSLMSSSGMYDYSGGTCQAQAPLREWRDWLTSVCVCPQSLRSRWAFRARAAWLAR